MAKKRKYKSKPVRRQQIIEYLGNPSNEWLCRADIARIALGYKNPAALYFMFSTDELSEIEAEALEIRRKKYAPEIAEVDKALLKEAKAGDVKAAKLIYQRFEGWSEKKSIEGHLGLELPKAVELRFVDAKAPFEDVEPEQIEQAKENKKSVELNFISKPGDKVDNGSS